MPWLSYSRNPARNVSIARKLSGSSSCGAWPRFGTVTATRLGTSRCMRSNVAADSRSECAPRNRQRRHGAQLRRTRATSPALLRAARECCGSHRRSSDRRRGAARRPRPRRTTGARTRATAARCTRASRDRTSHFHRAAASCQGRAPAAGHPGIRVDAGYAGRVDLGTDVVQHHAGERLADASRPSASPSDRRAKCRRRSTRSIDSSRSSAHMSST